MSNIRVSIVEDDCIARGIIAGWVRSAEGFECLSEHGSAESALAQLPATTPDVVLMDINLPRLNGVECVRRLKPRLATPSSLCSPSTRTLSTSSTP